jgi:hypothetical protein
MARKHREGTMTIRVDSKVLAALDIISGKRRAATGKSPTVNEILWWMVESLDPEVANQVENLAAKQQDTDTGKKEQS